MHSVTRKLVSAILAIAALCSFLPPQDLVARARVFNPSGYARTDIVSTVLPFAAGVAKPGMELGMHLAANADDVPRFVHLEPFGAPWADGSHRFLRATFPVSLAAGELRELYFAREHADPPSFLWHDAVVRWLTLFGLRLEIDAEAITFGAPEEISSNSYARVYRMRGRTATLPFWAELHVALLSGLRHARFWLHYGHHDQRQSALTIDLQKGVTFVANACAVALRHDELKLLDREQRGEESRLQLMGPSRFGHGQSQVVTGSLLFALPWPVDSAIESSALLAENQFPTLAIARGWPQSGAFTIFGNVPELPPWTNTAKAEAWSINRARELYLACPRATPWGWKIFPTWPGLLESPGSTGDQFDFGTMKNSHLARLGLPHELLMLQRAVYQEACRPVHFRELDVSPVTMAAHPNLLLWTQRPGPRWNAGDMLGVKDEMDSSVHVARSNYGNPWFGDDRQHDDPNSLVAYTLLTGDLWARKLIDYRCDLWLGENPTDSANETLNGMEAERAVARDMQFAANAWLITGRADVRTRISERVNKSILEHWTGKWGRPARPLQTQPANATRIQKVAWLAWQAGMSPRGLLAAYIATGNPNALTIAKDVSRTVCMGGFVKRGNDWQVAIEVAWNDGDLLTDAQKQDPTLFLPADGTDYYSWAISAVLLGERWAQEAGDLAWIERAREIKAHWLKRRTAPSDGGIEMQLTEQAMVVPDPWAAPTPMRVDGVVR